MADGHDLEFGERTDLLDFSPLHDVFVEFAVPDELGYHEEELVIVEEFVDSHDVRVRSLFKDQELILHELLKHLVLINFLFPDDFDCTLNFGLTVKGNSDLAEAALSEDPADLVLILDVLDLLEPPEVLKVRHMGELGRRVQRVVCC